MSDPEVRAGGGVVYRAAPALEVLLVHRPRYDDWSFPKGKLDPGERWRDGAEREVWEETGLRCSLDQRLIAIRYRDGQGRAKEVRYWAMTPLADAPFEANDEVDELAWLDATAARRRLSYPRDEEVLDAFLRWREG